MWAAIKYNLANLGNFSGRDARSTFWFWVLAIAIVQIVIWIALMIPMMGGLIGEGIHAAQQGKTNDDAVGLAVMHNMSHWMTISMWVGIVLSLVSAALLAASFTRRLHDADFSGIWTIAAALCVLASSVLSVRYVAIAKAAMDQARSMDALKAACQQGPATSAMSLIGWLPYILIIAFGVRQSIHGPNRYGEEPEGI